MRNTYVFILLVCFTGLASLTARADTQACTLEGQMNVLGTLVDTRDCMETSTELPVARFKESCSALAQLGAIGGGTPAKVTYSEKCPANPQAACKHFMGQPADAYYYRRDAELLKTTREGCTKTGGTWWVP